MADLRNTIAHILEHEQHLADANEATTQQYVVLPILRALGWDDTNLASMEVIPEHNVENGNVDYALRVAQKSVLFIECKKWNSPLAEKQASQIFRYAFEGGAPIVGLTNGKIWRFYFSWVEGTSMGERVFSDIDIADLEKTVFSLERYLLKSNVASGKAERNARIALEEKRKTMTSEISPIIPNPNLVDAVVNDQSKKRPITILPESDVEWTIDMVRSSLSRELKIHYEKTYSKERLELFYGAVAGVQNLIKKEKWGLNPPKFSKMLCGFWLTDKGVIGKIRRIFGILPEGRFPVSEIVGKDGELIGNTRDSSSPRLFVRIAEKDAEQLEHQNLDLDGCKFCGVEKDKSVDYVYYDIPKNMSDLFPVLEFAYNKHRKN